MFVESWDLILLGGGGVKVLCNIDYLNLSFSATSIIKQCTSMHALKVGSVSNWGVVITDQRCEEYLQV